MDKEVKYDLSFLNKISNSDKKFIKEMIVTFIKTAPDTLSKMEKCLQNNQYSALSRHAHKFIPGISFLGIKYIEEDFLKIEDHAKTNTDIDKIPGLLENVKMKINKLISRLEEDFNLT